MAVENLEPDRMLGTRVIVEMLLPVGYQHGQAENDVEESGVSSSDLEVEDFEDLEIIIYTLDGSEARDTNMTRSSIKNATKTPLLFSCAFPHLIHLSSLNFCLPLHHPLRSH